jgi:hypothetical protein
MTSAAKTALIIVGLVFGLVGVGMLGGAWWTGKRQYTILKTWPSVDAVVTKSEVISYRDSEGKSMHRAAVEFRYTVNGREYVTPTVTETATSSYSEMSGKVTTYSPGSHHSILYNPADPRDIRFGFGYNFDTFFVTGILGLFGVVFTPVGFGILFFMRPGRQRECPSCGGPVEQSQKFCPNCAAPLPTS